MASRRLWARLELLERLVGQLSARFPVVLFSDARLVVSGPDQGSGSTSIHPFLTVTDTDLSAGQVIKSVAGGRITRALGAAGPTSANAGDGDGDLVKGVAYPGAQAGQQAAWYASGSRVPIAGLPVGPIYRSRSGLLVANGGLAKGDYTNQLGVSDGVYLDVLVSPPFEWSGP